MKSRCSYTDIIGYTSQYKLLRNDSGVGFPCIVPNMNKKLNEDKKSKRHKKECFECKKIEQMATCRTN